MACVKRVGYHGCAIPKFFRSMLEGGHYETREKRDGIALGLLLFGFTAGTTWAVNDEPLRDKWAPSEWGADDKAGAVNRTTAAMVLKAVGLVKRGKVATLGKIYASDMPFFGSRSWKLTIPGLPTGGPFGPQELYGNDELLTTENGQVGTQFDGPGHIGIRTSKGIFYYNGRFLSDKGISG